MAKAPFHHQARMELNGLLEALGLMGTITDMDSRYGKPDKWKWEFMKMM